MGIIHRNIPKVLAVDLSDKYELDILIETGTHVGKTAVWATDWFTHVYTIESVTHYYEVSRNKLRHKKNVTLINGFSQDVLQWLMLDIHQPCLFWLDAHWSRDLEGNKPDVICPVLEELTIIKQSQYEHVILIDDARLFEAKNNWPSLNDIKNAIERPFYIQEDVIVIE